MISLNFHNELIINKRVSHLSKLLKLQKMKIVNAFIMIILTNLFTFGQNETSHFYKTTKSEQPHYVERANGLFKVYQMGILANSDGTGYTLIKTDTLTKVSEQNYVGKLYTLSNVNSDPVLETTNGKKLNLENAPDTNLIYSNLNNAYYLSLYFKLSDSLNAQYPWMDYSYKNGFAAWNNLKSKNHNHDKFKRETDRELQFVYDSISEQQIQLMQTMNLLIENASNPNYGYSNIKNGLNDLIVENQVSTWHFEKAIYEISKHDPDYFYRIAEDFPDQRKIVFAAVGKDKELKNNLMRVEGHNEVKKEFSKSYRMSKSRPYLMIGGFGVLVGIIVVLL